MVVIWIHQKRGVKMENQTKEWLDHVKRNSKIFSKDDLKVVIETLFQVGKINAVEYTDLLKGIDSE
jgi:uncharacterized protein involved in type VI secretion and phage assembly